MGEDKERITFTIDGVEIFANPGMTVIEAADLAGIYIPRLCHHPDLPPTGHCRVCTVTVNGRNTAACTRPVTDGIEVENDTGQLNALRRHVIEMTFVEGNHYCPECEVSGDCELQAIAYRLGMIAPQYPALNPVREIDGSHPDVFIDRNRCILCGRCVRASALIDGKSIFGYKYRGINKAVAVVVNDRLGETELQATDKAVSVCPTQCIRVKRRGFRTPVGLRRYDREPIGIPGDGGRRRRERE